LPLQERELRLELKEVTSETERIRKDFEGTEARMTSAHNKEISSLRDQVKRPGPMF
jgi:hypothetical protein